MRRMRSLLEAAAVSVVDTRLITAPSALDAPQATLAPALNIFLLRHSFVFNMLQNSSQGGQMHTLNSVYHGQNTNPL